MKIGILTYHRAENFGAVMQAYALQETLKKISEEVCIIDYRNSHIEVHYHILNPSILWSRKNIFLSLKKYINRFRSLKSRKIKKKKYADFRRKYLNIQPVSIWQKCTLLITGSDQVWNLHLTGGFDRYYFLDFSDIPLQKRISYAASYDKDPDDLIYKEREKIQGALLKFDGISVREESLKNSLLRFIEREIDVVLDPTFLLETPRYDMMAVPPQETRYICVYHMTPTEEGRRLAEKIAYEQNLNVIEVFGGYNIMQTGNVCKSHLSPEELLGYLKYADKIVTTSFHGIVFALKFHKNFWVIDKGDNYRQRNILTTLGLSNRLVKKYEEADWSPIDYSKVDSKLQLLIDKSISFITRWVK